MYSLPVEQKKNDQDKRDKSRSSVDIELGRIALVADPIEHPTGLAILECAGPAWWEVYYSGGDLEPPFVAD